MAVIQPDLKWYTDLSTSKTLSPRCPFASVHRCPRYYESIALLGRAGVGTSIDAKEDQILLDKWKRSDLWPATKEQAAGACGWEGKMSHFFNFCPEVSFDHFGWFASHLSYHTDEIDREVAHQNLVEERAAAHDWRWTWSLATPMHYADCPLYSPLLLGVNEVSSKGSIGFSVG